MSEKKKLKVGVIFGGMSAEKEVSLATGRYVYSLVDQQKYEPIPFYMGRDSKIYHIPDKLVIQNKTEDIEKRLDEAEEVLYEELNEKIDVMFIALLGKYGEDGVIQGLLEMLKIPYTGSGILTSSVAMHKRVTRQILRGYEVDVPKDISIWKKDWVESDGHEKVYEEVEEKIGMPVVVKPTREGSSVGVSYADSKETLIGAVDEAFKHDNEVLVEEYIEGVEFMCVILGNENPAAMIPTEVTFEGEIHTYESKYMPGRAQYHTPPRLDDDVVQKIREISVHVYKLLGLKGYGRVDGFVADDRIIVSEPHTGTIMVPSSYVFQQASRTDIKTGKMKAATSKNGLKAGKGASGISPRDLITTIIDLAMDAHSDKKGTLQ